MINEQTFIELLKEELNVYIQKGHPYTELLYTPIDKIRASIEDEINLRRDLFSLEYVYDEFNTDDYSGLEYNDLQEATDAYQLAEFESHDVLYINGEYNTYYNFLIDDIVNKIAANYNVIRSAGTISNGVVTIAVSTPVAFDASVIRFTSGAGINFYPVDKSFVSEEQYSLYSDYYIVNLDVVSDTIGVDANVDVGGISSVIGFPTKYLYVKNFSPTYGGADKQSNTSVIEAIKNSVTDYSLTRIPGLARKLLMDFPNFKWFEIVGDGSIKHNILTTLNYKRFSADVWSYPGEYLSMSESIADTIKDTDEVDIQTKPAIGPYYLYDDQGEIPSIYFKIFTKAYDTDNGLMEYKRIKFQTPNNKFTTNSKISSKFQTFNILNTDKFMANDEESNVVRVINESEIVVESEYLPGDTSARTYNLLYKSTGAYVSYDEVSGFNRLYEPEGSVDFTSLSISAEPHLDLYQVMIKNPDGTYFIEDIVENGVFTDHILFRGEYRGTPVSFKIIKSNRMKLEMQISIVEWITAYTYFKATHISPEDTPEGMTEKVVLPLISRVSSENLYVEIGGEYYRIDDIQLDGQKLYISILYNSMITDLASLSEVNIYSLTTNGAFSSPSKLSDIKSSGLRLGFKGYPLEALQNELGMDDLRIITTDYMARLPYIANVKISFKYKGDISEPELTSTLTEYIDSLSNTSSHDVLLQASDIIDVCYSTGKIDMINLSTFSVKIYAYVPENTLEWSEVKLVEYELFGEDTKRTYVFVYNIDSSDISVIKID